MYVIVRADLPHPILTVQANHGAIAAERAYGQPHKPHPNLVVCTVPDERSLLDSFERLKQQGVPCCLWREADMNNEATAVGTGSLQGDARRPLRGFKLLR